MGTIERIRAKRRGGCPICGKPVVAEFQPFCSNRCRQLDLANWLDGAYAIPGEQVPDASGGDNKDDDA